QTMEKWPFDTRVRFDTSIGQHANHEVDKCTIFISRCYCLYVSSTLAPTSLVDFRIADQAKISIPKPEVQPSNGTIRCWVWTVARCDRTRELLRVIDVCYVL